MNAELIDLIAFAGFMLSWTVVTWVIIVFVLFCQDGSDCQT